MAFAGYSIFVAIKSLSILQGFKDTFLNETDFEMWKMIHEMIDAVRYTESTFWLVSLTTNGFSLSVSSRLPSSTEIL